MDRKWATWMYMEGGTPREPQEQWHFGLCSGLINGRQVALLGFQAMGMVAFSIIDTRMGMIL